MGGDNHKIICLMGPTASGKTEIAVRLVEKYPLAIISVDSAQIYKYMNIGTAKPDAETLKVAPHRMIDIKSPLAAYSVFEFLRDVKREISDIRRHNKIPLLTGGTMMYFKALQQGLADLPAGSQKIRARLAQCNLDELYARLAAADPQAALKIHPHDRTRISRALEVYIACGKTMTELQASQTPNSGYEFINYGIIPRDRSRLHKKIGVRFDYMLNRGLVEEVEFLRAIPGMNAGKPAMKSVGYRQIWSYLDGEYEFSVMKEKGLAATRRLAKRQITWLRSWRRLELVSGSDRTNRIMSMLPTHLQL